MDMCSGITEGLIYSASESARTSSQHKALQEDSNTITQQAGAGGPSAVSKQSVRDRSVHHSEGCGGSVRKHIPMNYQHIVNVEQAENFLSESKNLAQFDSLKFKKNGEVLLPNREVINSNKFLEWLSSVIACCLICNRMDEAEKHINFAVDTVNAKANILYSDENVGRIYFLKFDWCLKKLKQAEIAKEIAAKPPEGLSAQQSDTHSDVSLKKEMKHSLEIAIRLRDKEAVFAGIVYYLDEDNTLFTPCAERGFELLDIAIKSAKSSKYTSTNNEIPPKDGFSIYFLLASLLQSIKVIESMGAGDTLDSSSKYDPNLYGIYCVGLWIPFTDNSLLDYLTDRKDESPLFLSFLGGREILFKYLQVSLQILLYTLLKEDEEKFTHVYQKILDIFPDEATNLVFTVLAANPAYREYIYVRGEDRRRPTEDDDSCEFDPVISQDKLRYLNIKQKINHGEWKALESFFDTLDITSLPDDQRSQYVDVLIKSNRIPEALEQMRVLINHYQAEHRYYDEAMAAFKMEELDELLINDKDPMCQVMSAESVDARVVTPDPDITCDVDKADRASAAVQSFEPCMEFGLKTPLEQKTEQPVTPSPSPSNRSGQQPKKIKPVNKFNYHAVRQKIQNEMTYGSLGSTLNLINDELSNSTLELVHRGRLLWHKGWAYKALARNQRERGLALACFSKALSCAVRDMGEPRFRSVKEIDPVKFLLGGEVKRFIYRESYRDFRISLIADVYSASGNYFRDMGQPDNGGKCSNVADNIKPWRRERHRQQPGRNIVLEPKVRLIRSKSEVLGES